MIYKFSNRNIVNNKIVLIYLKFKFHNQNYLKLTSSFQIFSIMSNNSLKVGSYCIY